MMVLVVIKVTMIVTVRKIRLRKTRIRRRTVGKLIQDERHFRMIAECSIKTLSLKPAASKRL